MTSTHRMNMAAISQSSGLVVGWLTMFAIGCDLFVMSPLLPLIAADYEITPALAGLSVTVFSLAYMPSAPLLGPVSDRFGRERVLRYCLCAFAAANLLTAVAANLIWLLIARLLAGVAAAGVSPSVYALAGGSAPSAQRATWLSIMVSGLLMALSFGAPLGGLIGAAFGWPMIFFGLAASSLPLARANSRVWLEGHTSQKPAAPSGRLTIRTALRRLVPTVVWSTALYATYTYLGEGLAAFGYSAGEISGVILVYGCGAIGGVLIGGRLADRLGAGLTSAVSLAGLCLCFILLRLALDAGVLVHCAFALASAAAQLFFPAQQVRLAQEFPSARTTILAWNNSALFLGISLGSLIGGQAILLGGLDVNLEVSAGIAIAGWAMNQASRSARGAMNVTPTPRPSGPQGAR